MVQIEMPVAKPLSEIREGETILREWKYMIDKLERLKSKKCRRKRKKVKVDKIPFGSTPIGTLLKHYAPNEYWLLTDSCENIPCYLIESIAYSSDNEFFRTARFRKALAHYKKYGRTKTDYKGFTLEDELKYASMKVNGLV